MNIRKKLSENKREILIIGGSTIIFGLGVYLILQDAKFVRTMKNACPDIKIPFKGFDSFKDKDIISGFITVEYADGEIGILDAADLKKVANKLVETK